MFVTMLKTIPGIFSYWSNLAAAALSLRALSMLIIVLNFKSNSHTSAISESDSDACSAFLNSFLCFSIPCNFLLESEARVSDKRNYVSRPLVWAFMFIWLAIRLYLLSVVAIGVRLEGAGGYCPSLRWVGSVKTPVDVTRWQNSFSWGGQALLGRTEYSGFISKWEKWLLSPFPCQNLERSFLWSSLRKPYRNPGGKNFKKVSSRSFSLSNLAPLCRQQCQL